MQSIARHGKIRSIYNKQHLSIEGQFIRKLSNTGTGLKNALLIKKERVGKGNKGLNSCSEKLFKTFRKYFRVILYLDLRFLHIAVYTN